jgi:hypothetical protein
MHLHNRLQPAIKARVPVTNYGMTISYFNGINQKVIALFTANSYKEDIYF